ncbi:cobyrinate a,c-diamide synthase [Halochromatium glycolicum]|uniref:Cobyrinic acid a,c-diamide synthase n=1 Tax=Halochromatium glycolicum TaxID=85075 RepID=A0AAJ0U6K5_9GAMM|nr:cobyrinate a,c-diamide synthase [Halochromatium glycolicum]MBK1706253.1 cobyrinic acid a,c-diamide synthase [Halochromatium glycolicum]
MAHLYLSAPQKSSGKTTLSIGLTRELLQRGEVVQTFKKGPDYIDPLWLARAAGGRPCFNLDFHTMGVDEIRGEFARFSGAATIGLIEGNVGLFDSIHLDGAGSNAELAKLLEAPVLLVIDAQGMGRGIAPLLLGYQAFDPALNIAGVVLNRVGGSRHEANLRRVVEYYTDLPVVGAVPRAPEVVIEERHLGLIPSNEAAEVEATIESIRRLVASSLDLDQVLSIAACSPTLEQAMPRLASTPQLDRPLVRIGLAMDDAFGFYYPGDLVRLEQAGAQLMPFSPVADAALPEVDGLILGGGFPECRMRELEANHSMREAIAAFIADGGPAYAECGGLMYLCDRLHWKGETRRMCGVLAADVAMHPRPQGRGYMRLQETEAFPWPADAEQPAEICAHEFHHSAIIAPSPDWRYAYRVLRGAGIDGAHDGIIQQNLLASYAHLRDTGSVHWTRRFVNSVRDSRH